MVYLLWFIWHNWTCLTCCSWLLSHMTKTTFVYVLMSWHELFALAVDRITSVDFANRVIIKYLFYYNTHSKGCHYEIQSVWQHIHYATHIVILTSGTIGYQFLFCIGETYLQVSEKCTVQNMDYCPRFQLAKTKLISHPDRHSGSNRLGEDKPNGCHECIAL